MLPTNKLNFLLAAALLSGVFCAATALAQPSKPDYYEGLSAVEGEGAPQAPAIAGGFYGLGSNERRYAEPLQLSGPSAKIKQAKYKKISRKAKHAPVHRAKVRTVKF